MGLIKILAGRINDKISKLLSDHDIYELLKGSSTTLILKVGGFLLSYIFYFVLARLYGAEVMGIFALAITLAGIFALIGNAGMDNAIVRFVAENMAHEKFTRVKAAYKKSLHIVLPLSIAASLVMYIASSFLANRLFHKPEMLEPFRIIAFAIPFMVFTGLNVGALRGLKKIGQSFIFQTVLPPLFNIIALTGITYILLKGYLAPIYANVLSASVGAFISGFLIIKSIRSLDTKIVSQEHLGYKELLKVSLPMSITSAMVFIMGWTDVLMLGIFTTSEEVGIYRVALKIGMITSICLVAVNSIAAPKFAELYFKNETERLSNIIKKSSKLIFWSSFPILLMLALFSEQVLSVFGNKFTQGHSALIILCIGQFVNASCGSIGVFLNMTGNQNIIRNAMFAGVVVNIILNYILIPIYGITGAAIATAIGTISWNLIASLLAYRLLGFWVGYIPYVSTDRRINIHAA